MRIREVSLFILFGVVGASLSANAQNWTQTCQSAGQTAYNNCKSTESGARGAGIAGAAGAAAKNANSAIKNPGKDLASESSASANRAAQVAGVCGQQKTQCEKICDEQEKQRAANEIPNTPLYQPALSQKGKVEAAKKNSCTMPIETVMKQMGADNAQGNQASGDSKNTEKSAQGGGMPPMQPPQQPPPGGGEEPPAEDTAQQINCGDGAAATVPECDEHFASKCAASMSGAGCDVFTSRYCAKGSGVGSTVCAKANATKYCTNPAKASCASCQNLNSPWGGSGAAAASGGACADDPGLLAMRAASMNGATAPVGGAKPVASGTVGFSTMSTMSEPSARGLALKKAMAKVEEKSKRDVGSLEVEPNGGRAVASVANNGGTEVAANVGSIFNIQSTTYRDLCAQGRLHCR